MTRGKRPTTGNGVGASSLEIRTGNLSKSVTCGHVFEPKLNAQQGAICEAFFWKCFEQSTSWCFGSHFFLIDSLPFATVVFWLHLKTKTKFKEKHGKKTPLSTYTATSCSTLVRHALKLICQTTFDSILFNSLLSHAGQLSCCDVTEITWPKRGIFSCRRRRCSKRRVCFHSNQYFYVPQENVNLSNEQRVS